MPIIGQFFHIFTRIFQNHPWSRTSYFFLITLIHDSSCLNTHITSLSRQAFGSAIIAHLRIFLGKVVEIQVEDMSLGRCRSKLLRHAIFVQDLYNIVQRSTEDDQEMSQDTARLLSLVSQNKILKISKYFWSKHMKDLQIMCNFFNS